MKSRKTQAEAVAGELFTLLHHEHAEMILSNDWLHYSSLPIPSVDAIMLLAHMLVDPSLSIGPAAPLPAEPTNFFEFLGSHPMEVTLPVIITQLRKHSKKELADIANRDWIRFEQEKLLHEGQRRAEWALLLHRFRFMAETDDAVKNNGARGLARRFMETLFLRSMHMGDSGSLRALADEMDKEGPQPCTKNRIASEIVASRWRLSEELDRNVTKGAMKAFLCELHPNWLKASSETWKDAWKLAGVSKDGDREGPRNNSDAIAVARKILKEWQNT